MHRICLISLLALWPVMGAADTARGGQSLPVRSAGPDTLSDLRWQARPVMVLGDTAQVRAQIDALQARASDLAARDVIVLTDGPGAESLRTGLPLTVLLIGKDGGVKLREDGPVTPARLIELIDAMPMRQSETR